MVNKRFNQVQRDLMKLGEYHNTYTLEAARLARVTLEQRAASEKEHAEAQR
jgi:hypothetical protein